MDDFLVLWVKCFKTCSFPFAKLFLKKSLNVSILNTAPPLRLLLLLCFIGYFPLLTASSELLFVQICLRLAADLVMALTCSRPPSHLGTFLSMLDFANGFSSCTLCSHDCTRFKLVLWNMIVLNVFPRYNCKDCFHFEYICLYLIIFRQSILKVFFSLLPFVQKYNYCFWAWLYLV